jgi:hypothetical protein
MQFPSPASKAELAAMDQVAEASTSEVAASKGAEVLLVWSVAGRGGNAVGIIGAHHLLELQLKVGSAYR